MNQPDNYPPQKVASMLLPDDFVIKGILSLLNLNLQGSDAKSYIHIYSYIYSDAIYLGNLQ